MNAQSRLDKTGAGYKEVRVESRVRSWRVFLQTSALFPEKESFENPVLSRAVPTKTHTHTHTHTHIRMRTHCSPLAPDVNASIERATGLLPTWSLHCRTDNGRHILTASLLPIFPSHTPYATHTHTHAHMQLNSTQSCRQRTARISHMYRQACFYSHDVFFLYIYIHSTVVFESDRCETMSCYPQHVCVFMRPFRVMCSTLLVSTSRRRQSRTNDYFHDIFIDPSVFWSKNKEKTKFRGVEDDVFKCFVLSDALPHTQRCSIWSYKTKKSCKFLHLRSRVMFHISLFSLFSVFCFSHQKRCWFIILRMRTCDVDSDTIGPALHHSRCIVTAPDVSCLLCVFVCV